MAHRRGQEVVELRERVGQAEGESGALREQVKAERGRADQAEALSPSGGDVPTMVASLEKHRSRCNLKFAAAIRFRVVEATPTFAVIP
jgi:hypothetical protein